MKIIIEGEPEEIAALASTVQERRKEQMLIERPLAEVLRTLGLSNHGTHEASPAQ